MDRLSASPDERRKILLDGGIPPPRAESNGAASNGKPERKRGTKETRGRFNLLNTFVDKPKKPVSGKAIIVWMVLYRHGRSDGTARVPVSQITQSGNLSKSSVIRALNELRKVGYLEVIEQGSSYKKKATKYRLIGDPIMGA